MNYITHTNSAYNCLIFMCKCLISSTFNYFNIDSNVSEQVSTIYSNELKLNKFYSITADLSVNIIDVF